MQNNFTRTCLARFTGRPPIITDIHVQCQRLKSFKDALNEFRFLQQNSHRLHEISRDVNPLCAKAFVIPIYNRDELREAYSHRGNTAT